MSKPDGQTSRPIARRLLALVAAALLIVAMIMAASQIDRQALASLSTWVWLALASLVVVNLFLTSMMFWLVTLSFDAQPRVSFPLTLRLIAASALFNYLPLRAGLLGRAAALRVHHKLPVRQSVLILLIVLTTGCIATILPALFAWTLPSRPLLIAATLGTLILLSAITPLVATKLLRRRVVCAWLWIPIRFMDTLVASARLWIIFHVMGHPLTPEQAVITGAAGLLIAMTGLTPNGLGLREWCIALLSQSMTATTLQAGLAVTLIERGVEAIVICLLGSLAILSLKAWLRPPTTTPSSYPVSPSHHTTTSPPPHHTTTSHHATETDHNASS